MITLFKADETIFSHDGVEVLDDIVISSYTSWSENGKWVSESKFKKDYDKSESIKEGMILQLPTEKGLQLFRILKLNKKNKKYITTTGQHIAFDFENNFIQDINIVEKSGRAAIKQIQGGTVFNSKYNLTSNIDTVASARMVRKNGITSLVGSDDNCFINRWGGYLVLDNFNISMNTSVGQDRGVEVLIGKNLTDMECSIDISSVVTGINPITYDGLTLPEGVYYSSLLKNYPEPRIKEFKFDNIKYKYSENNYDEEGYETLEEVYAAIRVECDKLFNESNIDKPNCNLRLNVIDLTKTDQYKGIELNERIFQGDIITANLEEYGFNVKLKMTANKYNNIKDCYEDFDLGDLKSNVFSTIDKVQTTVDKVVEQLGGNSWQDILDKSMKEATELIEAGIKDSYVVARKNEILIMDSPQVESSINVIRMNKNGIAFSQQGYNGPYTLAITIDGKINASCITTGELNASLIKTGTIMSANGNLALSIDDDYLEVTHSEGNTRTRIDNEGFYILDENNEIIASLASKESWTELKADKVFAKNIENVYIGDSNLYVDHNSNNIIRNGSIDYPFTDFNQLREYVQSMPIINKDLFIYVVTEGVVNDLFYLTGLSGNGKVDIRFNNKFILKTENDYGVVLRNISNWVSVYGGRTSYQSKDGFMIQATNGIEVINCSKFELSSLLTDTSAYGIHVQDSHGKMDNIDFCKAYSALGVRGGQVWLSGSCRGSNTKAVRAFEGTLVTIGENDSNSIRQQGILEEVSGTIKEISTIVETASTVYAPVIPPTINTYKDFSITSMATYQYLWSNWKVGECKSGVYGSYGDKAGHLFFDLSAIRSFLNGGTVLDGATITLTRANSGGSSSGVKIYVGGSSCNGTSGTPSYYNKTYVGTLSWGQTNTFTLSKSIVDGIKNGTINSITTHGSDYSNITACSINLKINK